MPECDVRENFDTNECPNIFVSKNYTNTLIYAYMQLLHLSAGAKYVAKGHLVKPFSAQKRKDFQPSLVDLYSTRRRIEAGTFLPKELVFTPAKFAQDFHPNREPNSSPCSMLKEHFM